MMRLEKSNCYFESIDIVTFKKQGTNPMWLSQPFCYQYWFIKHLFVWLSSPVYHKYNVKTAGLKFTERVGEMEK